MNRLQKIAWFQLTVIVIAAIAGIFNSWLYMQKYEYTFLKAWWFGMGWPVGLCLFLVVFSPLFFRKKKGRVNFDERDLVIDRRATRTAFGAAYFFFIIACITIWETAGLDALIPAYWLSRIMLGGLIMAVVVHPLTTVVCYGRGGKKGES